MELKLTLTVLFLIVTMLNLVIECKYIPPNQYQEESDVEFVTPGYRGGGIPGYPQGPTNIFKDWMDFIQGFFKEGNWDNGGPGNLAGFIGTQITKLVQMLTRDDTSFQGKK